MHSCWKDGVTFPHGGPSSCLDVNIFQLQRAICTVNLPLDYTPWQNATDKHVKNHPKSAACKQYCSHEKTQPVSRKAQTGHEKPQPAMVKNTVAAALQITENTRENNIETIPLSRKAPTGIVKSPNRSVKSPNLSRKAFISG